MADAGEGVLKASVSATTSDEAALTFNNRTSRKPKAILKPTSVILGAKKTLDGEAPGDMLFDFDLLDDEGNILQTVSNDGDGTIAFAPIAYSKAGTYEYSVREVNDAQQSVVYDEKSYPVTVTVTDGGAGQLVAKVSYGDVVSQVPTFQNSTEPTPEEPETPQPEEPSEPDTPVTPDDPPTPKTPETPVTPETPTPPTPKTPYVPPTPTVPETPVPSEPLEPSEPSVPLTPTPLVELATTGSDAGTIGMAMVLSLVIGIAMSALKFTRRRATPGRHTLK